jgi:hypothetical protein
MSPYLALAIVLVVLFQLLYIHAPCIPHLSSNGAEA